VNRAHYQSQTFVLLKNGVPFARLVPAGRPMCCGSDLAAALASVELSDADA
jgi:antitoxin (DNA-binding transcriptional repressor) of toxin-antitoxin stability system